MILKPRTRRLTGLTLLYIGFLLLIFPGTFSSGNFSELLYSLLNTFGQAFLIAGIVWFIVDIFYTRLDASINRRERLLSKGIREVKVITSKETDEILEYFSTSPSVSIQVNILDVNLGVFELINRLLDEKSKRKVDLLITGANIRDINNPEKYPGLPFATKMLAELLTNKQNVEENPFIEIRSTLTKSKNILIFGGGTLLILMNYGIKSNSLLLINIDIHSDDAEEYRSQFIDQWTSVEINR